MASLKPPEVRALLSPPPQYVVDEVALAAGHFIFLWSLHSFQLNWIELAGLATGPVSH